jgi:hypothetical protein
MHATCDKVGGVVYGPDGHEDNYGFGRINAFRAADRAYLAQAVFVHFVTAQNISGAFPCTTYVNHPLTNSNPNAILFVTHNWNPLGMPSDQGQFNNHPIGVWYDEGIQRWAIFNEDQAAMSEGVAFNVSVRSYPSL